MAGKRRTNAENSVVTRTVIVAGFLLTGLFILLFFMEGHLAKIFHNYAGQVTTGLMLLSLWLVVGSSIRTVYNLKKRTPGWKLMLTGILTAAVSGCLYAAFLIVYPQVTKSPKVVEVAGASGLMLLLLTSIAFVVSLIALIHLRVKNKTASNVLEFIIMVGSILLFVYFINR
ncbi:MAG: hypothetical protein ACE5FF_06860 [Saprospiraceae bacterium]